MFDLWRRQHRVVPPNKQWVLDKKNLPSLTPLQLPNHTLLCVPLNTAGCHGPLQAGLSCITARPPRHSDYHNCPESASSNLHACQFGGGLSQGLLPLSTQHLQRVCWAELPQLMPPPYKGSPASVGGILGPDKNQIGTCVCSRQLLVRTLWQQNAGWAHALEEVASKTAFVP